MSLELNPITSGYSTGLINDNFQAIEDYVNDKLLQRDGVEAGEINQMEVDLDMNSHFIYNLPEPILEHQAARLQDVQNAVAGGAANLITFTPYGSIASENVQGAIQELADTTAQDPNTFEVDTDTGTQTLQNALNDRLSASDVFVETVLSVNIPTDYLTIQEAIDDLSPLSVKQGAIIDIIIEAGHQPTAGVLVENGDYSHFRISSVDAEVTLDPAFPATDIIKGINARMPVLNCLINANSLGVNGYFAENGSSGVVSSGCGIKFASQHGLYANSGSYITAGGTIFTSCSQGSPAYSGILAWASKIDAFGADVSGSLYYGAQAAASGTLYFRSGIANNCARHAIRATNGAITIARDASALNAGVSGIRSFDKGIVHANSVDVSGSATGIWCENGSEVIADAATGNNTTGSFIFCNKMSRVSAAGASASGAGGAAVRCESHSEVYLGSSTITAPGVRVLTCAFGSKIVTNGGALSGGDGGRAINLVDGSEVVCTGTNLTASSTEASLAVVRGGSKLSILTGTHSYPNDAVDLGDGSLLYLIGSGIPAVDVPGMANATISGRGIMWGAV